MSVRYAYDSTISSSLATYQRENGQFLLCRPLVHVPFAMQLRLQRTGPNNTVTEDSIVEVAYSTFVFRNKDTQMSQSMIYYLYDSLGYVIGQTRCHPTTNNENASFPMYRYKDTKQLKLGDIFQHIPAPLANAVFRIEVISFNKSVDSLSLDMSGEEDFMAAYFNSHNMRDMECTAPTVVFELKIAPESSGKIQSNHNDANKDNNYPVAKKSRSREKKKRDNHNQVKVNKYSVQSLIDKSEYFMKCIPKTPNSDGKVTVSVSDVDPELFRRFVDFVHYEKSVYLMTEGGLALQQCCHEMLEVADRFLCPELASDCALCIVQDTSKDTVFADIHFLATHYNGTAKMKIISRMARKLKELKPENQLQQLNMLSPNVATCLLYRLIN